MTSASAKMNEAQAKKIAAELVNKESDGMFAQNGNGNVVKTSATSTRITCRYDVEEGVMHLTSSYIVGRDNLLEELKSLEGFDWN
jgi:uncharacterized membrane protein